MIKHIIAFLCITVVLSVSGIILADFGAADCAALGLIVLSVYAAALHITRREKNGCIGCSGCSGCSKYKRCSKKERQR